MFLKLRVVDIILLTISFLGLSVLRIYLRCRDPLGFIDSIDLSPIYRTASVNTVRAKIRCIYVLANLILASRDVSENLDHHLGDFCLCGLQYLAIRRQGTQVTRRPQNLD